MRILQSLFNFYLQSSLHVAFAVYALLQMTQHMFDIQNDSASGYFAFFGTIVGYNFVKYDALARKKGLKFTFKIKAIIALSIISSVKDATNLISNFAINYALHAAVFSK